MEEELAYVEEGFADAIAKNDSEMIEMPKSDQMRVCVCGDTAIVSALIRPTGKFMGHEFSSRERSTGVS